MVNGHPWLVYDQYVGQTMNLMNRLFIESEGSRPGIVYAHKILAEKFLDYGQHLSAGFLANFYDNQRGLLKPRRVDEVLRGIFTMSQEQFSIYHELAHQVWARRPPGAEFIRQHTRELLQEKHDRFLEETPESIIAGFEAGPPEARHHAAIEEIKKDVFAQFETAQGKLQRALYLEALNAPDVEEELFCDLLAAELTAAWLDSDEPQPDVQTAVLRAIYVGSYHLKALALLEWQTQRKLLGLDIGDVAAGTSGVFEKVQVRNHLLKDHLVFMFRMRVDPKIEGGREADERVEAFRIQLMTDQARYYEAILDPFTQAVGFVLGDGRIEEMESEMLERLRAGVEERGGAPLPESVLRRRASAAARILAYSATGWPIDMIERSGAASAAEEAFGEEDPS